MSDTRTGQCLCGAVTFEADIEAPHYHTCHCDYCRRWGGPAMAVNASALRIGDTSSIKAYGSSDYGERVFCSACGTHLFWRMKDGSQNVVWLGTLNQTDDFVLETEIFIDSKPPHYSLSGDAQKMTGEEFVAMVMGSQ